MSRPTKYNPKYHIPWVRGLAMQGLTVAEIAEQIGVAKSTLCLWVKKDKALSDALNEGREQADFKVEQSLYSRAMGRKVTERKTVLKTDEAGATTPSAIEITEKEYPPDTAACIFWLKNRNPKRWRDHPELFSDSDKPVLNVSVEGLNEISSMSDDELKAEMVSIAKEFEDAG